MTKFWSFAPSVGNAGAYELRIDDIIDSQQSWWGDEVTPKLFAADLAACPGPLTLWINSAGGDVFAAAAIYTMLIEHKAKYGTLTVKVSGVAASAASLIAMAGDKILISPPGEIMLHNPWARAIGDSREMLHMSEVLDEIKAGQIDVYAQRTGKSRAEIAALMDAETYMGSATAVANGFADGILYQDSESTEPIFAPSMLGRAAIYALDAKAAEAMAGARNQQQPIAPEPEPAPQPNTPDEPQPDPEADTDEPNIEAMGLQALSLAEGLD